MRDGRVKKLVDSSVKDLDSKGRSLSRCDDED